MKLKGNSLAQLSAHEMSVSKIFSSDYQFQIPEYQRPYSWGGAQARQLLDDLSDALARETATEPYFLGSLVLIKSDDSPFAEVIDGQQRLTTLTILLSVLRALSTGDFASALSALVIEPGNSLLDLEPKPRLRIRDRDAEFFQTRVQQASDLAGLMSTPDGALATDAQKNIRDNARLLHEVLRDWEDGRRVALSKLISSRTYLVVVTTPDIASAHRIFSVMNSRGLDLSAADIFKSDVIGSLPPESRSVFANKWEEAEIDLGRASFQDLFAHIRTIYSMTRPTRELLQEFPEQVLRRFLPGDGSTFIDDVLLPYADASAIIDNENYSWPHDAEVVNNWLRTLNQLDTGDWRPVALWLLKRHSEDPIQLIEHLSRLERLAASMLIRREYATPRGTRYANLLRSLTAGLGIDSPEYELSDDERRETLAQLRGPIYKSAPVRRYVLLRLNDLLSSTSMQFNPKIITVEHVLPQSPAEGSIWSELFDDELRDHWTHRLANLVLLDRKKNSEAQNYEFETKKKRYFKSASGVTTFAITVGVLNEPVWTPERLEERQRELLLKLAAAWDIERTEDGTSLVDLDEFALSAPTVRTGPGRPRTTVRDLIAAGLIEAGATLVWERPRVGDQYSAVVQADGSFELPDGRTFDTPSRAAREAAQVPTVDGWRKWTLPDGRRLDDLWRLHEGRRTQESVTQH
ncbi:DUF262 domain-containing protein [Curtobacterium sp. VKM Ac-2852]|uniref:GmrSD restriction endonuclease domain-containing protein n=1 Tax=Curtobacterium sp. VKM Ac-2852 TaxID=2739024 RepID=UPI001563CF23|nr:DUF262 domain-containing protein [Curtobacterium sp. VKM Ac-2852]NQX23439.1 DUF262 domain-containing protein [Curtobacterium sp. VKM Ac-2852]